MYYVQNLIKNHDTIKSVWRKNIKIIKLKNQYIISNLNLKKQILISEIGIKIKIVRFDVKP